MFERQVIIVPLTEDFAYVEVDLDSDKTFDVVEFVEDFFRVELGLLELLSFVEEHGDIIVQKNRWFVSVGDEVFFFNRASLLKRGDCLI